MTHNANVRFLNCKLFHDKHWTFRGMDRVRRIRYLSAMRAAKVQASLRIRAVSPEPSLLAHTSSESRGTFRPKARSLAPLNVWACAVKICHAGMFEDTNSLDGARIYHNAKPHNLALTTMTMFFCLIPVAILKNIFVCCAPTRQFQIFFFFFFLIVFFKIFLTITITIFSYHTLH